MPDNPADSQSFFDQQNLGKANGETRQNSPPAEGFNPEDLSPSPVQRPKIQPTPPDPKPSHKPKTPPAIKIIQNNKYSEKVDPPLIDVKVTNPITYLKNWLERLLKNQDIDIRIKIKPFATLALIIAFSATFGIGYNVGLKKAANVFFPDSSPILHREVTHQGTIQKTDTGKYYLSLPDASLWALNAASSTVSVSLANSVNRPGLS
ncbi:hypothetical protein KKE78_05290 [Patescibacteria group bacterium]|nr:hypothetical protein [Patescibacteria group bacterium]